MKILLPALRAVAPAGEAMEKDVMASRVVCISRTDGALGEAVGLGVARELGFRYVDEEVVLRAAEKAHVDPATIAEAERRKSFVRRLLDGLPNAATLIDPFSAITGNPLLLEEVAMLVPRIVKLEAPDLIRTVIREIADEGSAVIAAHAASMVLAGVPGVLRVLVTASPSVRAGRISRDGKLLDPSTAVATVRESDRNRQDYFRRFHDLDREEPTHYDLVISTDVLTPRQAATIVCDAARVTAV
jgi:Cytidylate kinase-like family